MKKVFKLGEEDILKAAYQTKQKQEILAYLQRRPGKHVTVNDLYTYFQHKNIVVGKTTIYRHLEQLVEQGVVAKYILEENQGACFEYLGDHDDLPLSIHCKCERCGKLLHVACHEEAHLEQHLLKQHGFSVNPLRTVFYGVCAACRKKDEGK